MDLESLHKRSQIKIGSPKNSILTTIKSRKRLEPVDTNSLKLNTQLKTFNQ